MSDTTGGGPGLEELNRPLFLFACCLLVVAFLVELGATGFLPDIHPSSTELTQLVMAQLKGTDVNPADVIPQVLAMSKDPKPPGLGIPYLALIDGLLLYNVLLMALALLVKQNIQAKVQGIVTLILSILLILGALLLLLLALVKLLLMFGLFVAVPFGTIVYLALYGFFNRAGSGIALSLVMGLKIGFVVLLVMAQRRFLTRKGLMLLVLTSLLANVIVSFLHGFPPIILVSMADAIAAIVCAILAIVWALITLVGSLFAVVKAVKSVVA